MNRCRFQGRHDAVVAVESSRPNGEQDAPVTRREPSVYDNQRSILLLPVDCVMFHPVLRRTILPACLTLVVLQTARGAAADEPRRLDAPRSGVSLLPPEAIDADAVEQAPVPSPVAQIDASEKLAMRDPVLPRKGTMTRPKSPRYNETQMSLLVICAGIAAGGFWLAFTQSRSTETSKSAVWRSSSELELLKPLIANSLVIMEETLILPQSARLHGRPMTNDRLRVDAAQPLADPHFALAPVAQPAVHTDADLIHWISPAEANLKQPTFQRLAPDLPERTSITLEKELG